METSPDFWILQLLIGLSLGLLLFLLASGFSLIFGLVRFVNLAHGSLFLVAAYAATSVAERQGPFPVTVGASVLVAAGLAFLIYIIFTAGSRVYGGDVLSQVLLTFGLLLIFADLVQWQWGGLPKSVPLPAPVDGSIRIGNASFPVYRFLVMGLSLGAAGLLWLVLTRTRLGALVRAGVDDGEMLRGMGVDTRPLFAAVFVLGGALAGLAAGLGTPLMGAYPGEELDVLLFALVIVVLGGLGSLKGAFIASIVVGIADSLGKALFPEFADFTIMAVVAAVLAWRPAGLFGLEGEA